VLQIKFVKNWVKNEDFRLVVFKFFIKFKLNIFMINN
jgi:hypothetical protein